MDPVTNLALATAEAAQHRRSAELLVREAAAQLQAAQQRDAGRHRFSIVRAIKCAADRGVTDGIERETSEELARMVGRTHDINRPWIPWGALTRAMNVGTSTAGGYLVGTAATPAVDALFPYSTLIRLGAQVFDGLTDTVVIPRVATNGTAYWTGEQGTATASQGTVGAHAGTPWQLGVYTEVSRPLLLQAPATAERMIGNHLLGLVGAAIDAAAIAGTGTDRPTGITKTSGLGALTTGTGFDWAAAQAMVKVAASANAPDSAIGFLAAPAVRELLAKRAQAGTAAPFVWGNDRVADRTATVNANCPASTLICGAFDTVYLLLWGGGIQIESNPYANFQASITGFRVLAAADVAVTQPGCFAVSTGLT